MSSELHTHTYAHTHTRTHTEITLPRRSFFQHVSAMLSSIIGDGENAPQSRNRRHATADIVTLVITIINNRTQQACAPNGACHPRCGYNLIIKNARMACKH